MSVSVSSKSLTGSKPDSGPTQVPPTTDTQTNTTGSLKKEFVYSKFSLNYYDHQVFYECQWRIPHLVYVVIRFLMFLYGLFALIYFITGYSDTMMKYFTVWSYIILNFHLGLAAFLTLKRYERPGGIATVTDTVNMDIPENPGKTSDKHTVSDIPSKQGIDNTSFQMTEINSNKSSITNGHESNIASKMDSDKKLNNDVNIPITTIGNHFGSREAGIEELHKTNKASGSQKSEPRTYTNRILRHHLTVKNMAVPDITTHNTLCYYKLSWLLHTLVSVTAPVVTLVYFTTIYPQSDASEHGRVGYHDINIHILNSAFVVIDQVLTARPVRILHAVYAVAYGLTYTAFSIVYWSLDRDNNVIYDILDWNSPGLAVGACVGLIIVFLLIQLGYYYLFRFKLFLAYKKI